MNPNYFPVDSKILGLSITPDGVRVAAIVHTASGSEVELAAIDSGKPGPGQSANPFQRTSIGPPVQLGPNVTNPIALTWYHADDLLVLDGAGDQTSLWEVPVTNSRATPLPGVLPGAISITANNSRNALVIGMTQNRMEVSAGFVGPWEPLGTAARARRSRLPPSRSRLSPEAPVRYPGVPLSPSAPESHDQRRPRGSLFSPESTLWSRYVTLCDWSPTSPPDIRALAS